MLGAGSSCSLFCLSLMFCLFCISGAPLWTMFWFLFLFFSPQGFSSTASEGFASLDDLSLPTSLWGQCHLPVTDGKQTGTGSKWVTQSHAAFCHLWDDGNSASSNRSLPLSHYVCYSLCREWSTTKPTLKATFNTQPVMTRTRSIPLPDPPSPTYNWACFKCAHRHLNQSLPTTFNFNGSWVHRDLSKETNFRSFCFMWMN